MHILLHAQLASVLSEQGSALLYIHSAPTSSNIHDYWTASRSRLELWHQAMARLNQSKANGNTYRMRCWWQDHLPLVQEVLVSELLTRVVAAIADGVDRKTGVDEFSPIAQAVFLSHLEARNRVQSAILDRRGCRVGDAVRLNRLRRMTERWIDVLIGNLASRDQDLIRYGIDPCRAHEHAQDRKSAPSGMAGQSLNWLSRAAMLESLKPMLAAEPALPTSNRQVANSVMNIWRSRAFDDWGVPKSLGRHRIESIDLHNDAEVESLLPAKSQPEESISPLDLIHAAALAQWFR